MTQATPASQAPRPPSPQPAPPSAPTPGSAPASSRPTRSRKGPAIASLLLLLAVAGLGLGLTAWKKSALAAAAAVQQPAPRVAITAAEVTSQPYQHSTTAIGTVLALRSVTLRNEEAGTVVESHLESGAVVEKGALLLALDVNVERAELRALEAQAQLAETLLARIERASANQGASEADVDRARAERDVALANVARTQARIERKTILAPFRARIGLSDVHPGQYLDQGTALTTLQGVDEAVHVDFAVPQDVAFGLQVGQSVTVRAGPADQELAAEIVARDARVDPATRSRRVRARLPGEPAAPGSSVTVRVPVGAARQVLAVPVAALLKSPAGDHVFVLQPDAGGALRAHQRQVISGAVLGETVAIESGLEAGERVAVSGAFKLFEGVEVQVAAEPAGASSH